MNVKNIKKITISILLSVLLTFILYIFGRNYLSLGGFTTLSLEKATFTSSSKYFNGPVWILTVVQGGVGQYAYGIIHKEDIARYSGKEPKNDLTIKITYGAFNYEYPIQTSTPLTPVYTFDYKTWFCLFPPSKDDAINKCGSDAIAYGKFPFSYTCFCINMHKVADVAQIGNCQFHTKANIEVDAGGKTYSSNIDSKGSISTFVGPYVYVVWNGNLVRNNCPLLSNNYVAFYYNGWKVGYKYYYNDYLSTYRYFMNKINGEETVSENTLKNLINDINTKASEFLNNVALSYNNIEMISNKPYIVIWANDSQAPVYTFYVKADFLGIYQPTPKPQIIYASGAEFKSGSTGYLFAEVKNVGDEAGTINVYAECEPPVYVVGSSKELYLNPGESGMVYIPITANVNEKTTAECTIYAKTVSYEDEKTVTVTVDKLYSCEEGSKICMNRNIYICKDGNWVEYQECQEGYICGYRYGNPVCINPYNNDVIGEKTNDLLSILSNYWIPIAIIVVALFILLFYRGGSIIIIKK